MRAPPSEPTGFSVRFSSEMQVLRSSTHKGGTSVSVWTLPAGPEVRIKGNITVYASLKKTCGGGVPTQAASAQPESSNNASRLDSPATSEVLSR